MPADLGHLLETHIAAVTKTHDLIFVGTGIISILEAVYQARCGRSVLMIDGASDPGGVWRPLDLFGLHDVENAIHYFLPSARGVEFMRSALGWNVAASQRKHRFFPLALFGYGRLPYDHTSAHLVGKLSELPPLGAIREAWASRGRTSYYVLGGAPEMVRTVTEMLRASSVQTRFSTCIDCIHVDKDAGVVEAHTPAGRFVANTIVLTHGSRVMNLTGPAGRVAIVERVEPRPAMHLLVRDDTAPRTYEGILTGDPLIKYVHDVTRFTREAAELVGRKKVLVLALQPHVRQSGGVYDAVFSKLERIGMVGSGAAVEGCYWQDAMLPPLEDQTLERLKTELGPQIDYLYTEDFAGAVGRYADRWRTKLAGAGAAEPAPSANGASWRG